MPEVFLLNAKRNVQADVNAVSRAENTLKTWDIAEDEIQAVRDEVKTVTSEVDRRAKGKETSQAVGPRGTEGPRRWVYHRAERGPARNGGR